MKRTRSQGGPDSETCHEQRSAKRLQVPHTDKLSILSDELVLRIYSFLPPSTLVICQRLSYRHRDLAEDPQLWKSLYYNRFVRPRAARIPRLRQSPAASGSLLYSSKLSRWLEDEHLVKRGQKTNWKRQYKLRHNWSRGNCDVREIQISDRRSLPTMLVQLYEDIVMTADTAGGLRAWSMQGRQHLVAQHLWTTSNANEELVPTSLAIDPTSCGAHSIQIAVGFASGGFGIYGLEKAPAKIRCLYMHPRSSNGLVSAIAYTAPFVVTMTDAQLLSLYSFPPLSKDRSNSGDPVLLSSLRSHTAWPPLSLSIRTSGTTLVVSVAYALPTYLSGWSVGLQELRLTLKGFLEQSRLTSAINQGFAPLSGPSPGTTTSRTGSKSSPRGLEFPAQLPSVTKPTSLSYSHPYLLASHADNTLTLYLVRSTDTELTIGSGSRLWGHTSSVSGAHVGDRGKAVSVSAHGNEIRVWELEGGVTSSTSRRRATVGGEVSVQVRPGRKMTEADSGPIWNIEGSTTTEGWVGFDEERVIVLREKSRGTQALMVYDFS